MSALTPAVDDPGWRLLLPRSSDLGGGLVVQRLLPAAGCRSVGPFVFFDHFGPVTLTGGVETDVRPHPHIGLATVTWLFEGHQMHRDSLGSVQEITPGALNWMCAGSGIVHSERTPVELINQPRPLHGLQLWVALPADQQDCAPSFQHIEADRIPEVNQGPVRVRVLAGTAFGASSPVRTASPTLYLELILPPGSSLILPPLAEQMALYAPEEGYSLDGTTVEPGVMGILPNGLDRPPVRLQTRSGATAPLRLMVIGGAPLDGPRLLWWNFVATDRARIEAAAARWQAGGFAAIPGDDQERIPLPASPF
jgi:redox-sensitive bicupin YhaK (pirin superfamily)